MILQTPIIHFRNDVARARNLLLHAETLPAGELKRDIFRASWMTAVGAFDAYFCDAYGDLLARTFRASRIQPQIVLPARMKNISVPVPLVLSQDLSGGWAWRMIARDLIEKDNVLSVKKVKELFNMFFRSSHKLFTANGIPLDRWIERQQSMQRLFGFQRTEYRRAASHLKNQLRQDAIDKLESRLEMIFQRRHDCIHNCDRPKSAVIQRHLTVDFVTGVIADIEFIVERYQEDFITEFPIFLTGLGFNAINRNRVGT